VTVVVRLADSDSSYKGAPGTVAITVKRIHMMRSCPIKKT
jgi:hypothetical protein